MRLIPFVLLPAVLAIPVSALAQTEVPVVIHVNAWAGENRPPVPAGQNVIIRINGREAGVTGENSEITAHVPPGSLVVEAVRYPTESGIAHGTATADAANRIEVTIDDAHTPSEPANFTVDGLRDGVLDRHFARLMMRFTDTNGQAVKLKTLTQLLVEPEGAANRQPVDLLNDFTVAGDGRILPKDVARLRQQLTRNADDTPCKLVVQGVDARGRIYAEEVPFRLAPAPLSASAGTTLSARE